MSTLSVFFLIGSTCLKAVTLVQESQMARPNGRKERAELAWLVLGVLHYLPEAHGGMGIHDMTWEHAMEHV